MQLQDESNNSIIDINANGFIGFGPNNELKIVAANGGFQITSNDVVKWTFDANGDITGGGNVVANTISGRIKVDNVAVFDTITPNKTIVIYDSSGQAYRVPCII